MTNLLTNGIGGTLGDSLALAKPLYTKSAVWYVSSVTGSNAFAGTDRERPLASLAQALTNSAANDIIVLLSGHTEVLTATYTLNKALTIIGEGTISGKPGASFQMNSAGNLVVLDITAANVQLRNVYIKTNLQASAASSVHVVGTDSALIGCYFEVSATDAAGLQLGATSDRALIKNCTFVSLATVSTAVPGNGLLATSAVADIELQGCVFDSGAHGYGNFAAQFTGTITRLRADGISLLNGADVSISSASTGWFNPQTVTGGSTVSW